MKRVSPLVVGLLLTASLLMPLAKARAAQAGTASDAGAFVAAINRLRAGRGSPPLAVDVRLNSLGGSWAAHMASTGQLADNPNLAGTMPPGWTKIGENVGFGPSVSSVETAFEHDPGHLSIMVDPAFSAVGVGVVSANNELWIAEEFMAGVAVVSPTPPPPPRPVVVWTGWRPEPAAPAGMAGSPAVSTWGRGRFDEFARGGDRRLWHRWSTDGGASYSGWENLGAPAGGLGSSPAAVSWGPGRIDVFAVGANRAVWHLAWQGRWSPWQDLGGVAASPPTVSSWSPGRLDVFVVGADRAVWHRWWDGSSWWGWESRSGSALFAPAATSWGPNRVDLFAVGTDERLWHSWWDGQQWNGWVALAGFWSAGPAAASWGAGRLDVAVPSIASGHPVAHFWYEADWHVEWLGGTLASAPAAATWGPGRLDLFGHGPNGRIYHDAYPGG